MPAEFARTLPASLNRLPGLIEAIEAWFEEAGVPTAEAAPLMIAFDEILSNIAKYGGGTIDLNISLAEGRFVATIADDGPPFDPLARDAPDLDQNLDDRAIGGLGIHLVRKMMDEVAYTYEKGQNRLTFSKTL